MPIAIRMDKHWAAESAAGMRAKERVRNDWNCLLLPVTMAVFIHSTLFIRSNSPVFILFCCCSHAAETRMIAVYVQYICAARESVCLCMCERVMNVYRESNMLNVVRVHLAELSSVVLCTSSTTTVARAHTYLSVSLLLFDGDKKNSLKSLRSIFKFSFGDSELYTIWFRLFLVY